MRKEGMKEVVIVNYHLYLGLSSCARSVLLRRCGIRVVRLSFPSWLVVNSNIAIRKEDGGGRKGGGKRTEVRGQTIRLDEESEITLLRCLVHCVFSTSDTQLIFNTGVPSILSTSTSLSSKQTS